MSLDNSTASTVLKITLLPCGSLRVRNYSVQVLLAAKSITYQECLGLPV